MIRIQTVDLPADRIDCDLVVTLYFTDVRPLCGPSALLDWRLNGLLTRLLRYRTVSGEIGEDVMTPGNHKINAPRLLFFGAGRSKDVSVDDRRQLLRRLLQVCCRTGFSRIAICLSSAGGAEGLDWRQLLEEETADQAGTAVDCYLSLAE